MADNSVFITGTTSGAFTEAFSDLPPWATESTALQLEKYLRKSFDVQSKIFDQLKKCCSGTGGGSGKMSPDDVKKVNDELDKLAKNLKRNNEEDAKKKKRDKDKEKEEKESLARGKKLKTTDDKLNYVFTALAAVGTKVLGVNKDYIDVYDSLYQSGINVLNGNNSTASGFEALNQMVNQTGLRLQTLQKVVEKYSTTVNAVGMAKFAKTLSMSNSRLQELGYSSEAQAELIGVLMESESGYTDIRNKTAAQLSADAIKLGGQLGRLSQTVGMSREQLQENLKATSKSTESAFVFAKFGKEAADKLNAATSGIKDSGLRDTFMQLAAAANPAQVKGYNELVQAGLGDVAEQMNALAKSGMNLDPVEFQKRLSSLTSYLEQQTGRMGNLTNLIGNGGDEAAKILNALYQQGRGVSQASVGQQDNATKTQATIAALQTEIESLAATMQKAFWPMEQQVNAVTGALKTMNGAIDSLIASINAETRSWIGVGLIVAGLIGSLLGAKKAVDTFFSLFSSKGPGMLSRAFTGIGKSIGSIGSVLGRLGGMLLRFAGPIAAVYAAFQLGQSIGEVLYETLSKMGGFNDFMDSIFSGLETGASWLMDGVKSIGQKFSDFGGYIYEKLVGAGKWIMSGFDVVFDYIKGVGKAFLSYMPWLQQVGEYISKITGTIGKIFGEISSFADSLIQVLKDIIVKFGHKMTFGLFEDEKPKEQPKTQPPSAAKQEPATKTTKAPEPPKPPKAEPVPVKIVTPMKAPSEISVPKAPAASTIIAPSAVPAEPPSKDGSKTELASSTGAMPAGIERPGKGADINSLLVNQGLLLEQILVGTNSLVSVNKDILRYARNSA